ncbi:uncharacterized protein TNCV_4447721 [Trichonephila clavipes]|nr:uncharacterized protein TNCV_4447721 [Trichonephila clavipes]
MSEWDYTNERVLFWMDLNEDFELVCPTSTSQNIYGHAPMIILLTMRPSRHFVKTRCHAVPFTRKRSADEVEKLAYQLNEEAERTERPIRRLSKVMYGSTCADMQVDVMVKCLSSIKHVVGVRSVFLAKRLHTV